MKKISLSKVLSIIYSLQTSLDFDKAIFEIANNLFQLYEYCNEIIKGFSHKIAIDVVKINYIRWEEIPSKKR